MDGFLQFTSSDRLLVLAPHPDDESLACGGLIQYALGIGATVSAVFATHGECSTWSQRVVERRWRIGAADCERWARRRRDEALHALEELGGLAVDARFLGWPDLGLTEALIGGQADGLIAVLAGAIANAAPTVIAAPSALDTHPDHSALRVLLAAALRRTRHQDVAILEYVVHGRPVAGGIPLRLTRDQQIRKLAAVDCHTSQMGFGRHRLHRYARGNEIFVPAPLVAAPSHAELFTLGISRWLRWYGARLLLAGIGREGEVRTAQARLGRGEGTVALRDSGDGRWLGNCALTIQGASAVLDGAWPWADTVEAFLKLERYPRGPVIFDALGWQTPRLSRVTDFTELPPARAMQEG